MPSLSLQAPDLAVHHDDMIDLIAKTFSHGGYFTFRDYCTRGYIDHSHYDPAASRIGFMEGKIVTHYGVWDYQMRIGRALVRTGGIGTVATHGDYRGRGLMDQTARASVAAMRPLGYDFTILFGISNFYYRFGYTRAWSDTLYYVPVSDLPTESPSKPVSPLKAVPRDDVTRLFNRTFAGVTGTALRPTFSACHYPGKDWHGISWNDHGELAGYVYFAQSGARLDVYEAVGDTEQVLRAIAAEARKVRCGEVRFETLPARADLADRLIRGTCRVEVQHNRCAGPMVRIINLAQALTKTRGELEHRLAQSPLRTWRGDLFLTDGRESATLNINRGKINATSVTKGKPAHAVRAGDELAQLMIGTDAPATVLKASKARLTGDAAQLLEALFPAQQPMLHLADRY